MSRRALILVCLLLASPSVWALKDGFDFQDFFTWNDLYSDPLEDYFYYTRNFDINPPPPDTEQREFAARYQRIVDRGNLDIYAPDRHRVYSQDAPRRVLRPTGSWILELICNVPCDSALAVNLSVT